MKCIRRGVIHEKILLHFLSETARPSGRIPFLFSPKRSWEMRASKCIHAEDPREKICSNHKLEPTTSHQNHGHFLAVSHFIWHEEPITSQQLRLSCSKWNQGPLEIPPKFLTFQWIYWCCKPLRVIPTWLMASVPRSGPNPRRLHGGISSHISQINEFAKELRAKIAHNLL